jgi:TatD DNase family protein
VGIGECGLDIPEGKVSYPTRVLEEQKELFKLQVGLAAERGLPVVIHNRNADEEVIKILEKYKNTNLKGVAHCYVSDWEFAKRLLHLNIRISFSGIITYKSAGGDLLDAVKKVPESSLLVETDAPWLPPQGHRGEVNYPKYVKITAAKIAEIRNSPYERIAELSYKNTCDLFDL